MEVLDGLDADQALPRTQRREHDKGAVSLGNLADLVHAAEQDAVDFGRRERDVLDKQSDASEELVDAELGLLDGLRRLARDQNLGRITALGIWRAVAEAA